ncbi:MAG: NPCBM/NEW2 domain-containing protein, partial [Armatimonadota bacterium]
SVLLVLLALLAAVSGTEPAHSLRRPATRSAEDCRRQATRIETRISRLRWLLRGEADRHLDSLETQIAYWWTKLGRGGRGPSEKDRKPIAQALDKIDEALDLVRRGVDPFIAWRGSILKGYRSEIDANLQPYGVHVPPEYDGTRPVPLVLRMHGHGGNRAFQGYPVGGIRGCIVLSPHGRGSVDYMYVGEVDVLRTIEEVRRDYNIDPARIYATGGSMGGTGSWTLAVHYPDIFAAIGPVCGNADHAAWEREWGWGERPKPAYDELRTFVRDNVNPIAFADNMAHVPVFCAHGSADDVVPVWHSRNMTEKMESLGYSVIYHEISGGGHGGFPGWVGKEKTDWLLAQRRVAQPKRVVFRTAFLRHHRAYWVDVLGLDEPMRFGKIEAEVVAPNAITVQTSNIWRLALNPREPLISRTQPLTVRIDGQETFSDVLPQTGALSFQMDDGGWRPTRTEPQGLVKRQGVEGPIEDAMLSKFIIVYGTSSRSPLERWITRAEAEAFAERWRGNYTAPCRVKADRDVTTADVETANLILYGGPSANLITAEVADELPIRITDTGIEAGGRRFEGPDIGVKFCYPNPMNPGRYVVVFAGVTWRGLYQINRRFGNWFDWGVYFNRNWFDYGIFDDKTHNPETFLLVGFFDKRWRLDPKYAFTGEPSLRRRAVPQRVPPRAAPSLFDGDLYLTDVLPAASDQAKGPLGFDANGAGEPVRIGGVAFERGLGTHAPSWVEFNIGGGFSHFMATVGVDLDGKPTIAKARRDVEKVQFRVYGDGKQLKQSPVMRWNSPPHEIR